MEQNNKRLIKNEMKYYIGLNILQIKSLLILINVIGNPIIKYSIAKAKRNHEEEVLDCLCEICTDLQIIKMKLEQVEK